MVGVPRWVTGFHELLVRPCGGGGVLGVEVNGKRGALEPRARPGLR
jgi:hypothetical protein